MLLIAHFQKYLSVTRAYTITVPYSAAGCYFHDERSRYFSF